MPPVEMLCELSEFYGVSINELISGKRLEECEEKQAAEENLKGVLSVSTFSLEERKAYFTKKWKREHAFELTVTLIVLVAAMIAGIALGEGLIVTAAAICGFAYSVISYNRMMGYVERNAFDGKNNNKK